MAFDRLQNREDYLMSNQERTLRFALFSLVGSVVLVACVAGPRHAQSIRIANATYSAQDRTIPCDVTTKMASICDGLAGCNVLAQSALCPMGDPAPMRQKLLTVEYACGAIDMPRAETPDGERLILACPQ